MSILKLMVTLRVGEFSVVVSLLLSGWSHSSHICLSETSCERTGGVASG